MKFFLIPTILCCIQILQLQGQVNTSGWTPVDVGNYNCGSAHHVTNFFAHKIGTPQTLPNGFVDAFYVVNVNDSNYCDLEFFVNNRSFMSIYGPFEDHLNSCGLINNGLINYTSIDTSYSVLTSTHPFQNYFHFNVSNLSTGIYVVKLSIFGGISLANPNGGVRTVHLLSNQPVVNGCFDFSPDAIQCEECITSFRPTPGRYMLSAWVKEDFGPLSHPTSYLNTKIDVKFEGSPTSYSLFPKGQIIDGWQRIEAEIEIPEGATDIHIDLVAFGIVDSYFDDIRFFPFDGSMMSYVYDPRNLRLMAQLDERNYATLYEYDEEGKLIRVKKETERGIMTIQENRDNIIKKTSN